MSSLMKKVDGVFVDVGSATEELFRGEWTADTLAKQYTFASGISSDFVLDWNASEGGATPTFVGVAELGYLGVPGPFVGAVRLDTLNINNRVYSAIKLDLSKVKVKNISRVSAWFGMGGAFGGSDGEMHQDIAVNGVSKAMTQRGAHAWVQLSAAATTSDIVSFRHKSTYGGDLNGWDTHSGVTGVQIFNRTDPYMLGDFVTYQGEMWQSLVDNNGDTPSKATPTWSRAITLPPPLGTTASRPSAVTAGSGYQFYDQSLNKPIWSDGAVWRDADGTQV